MLKVTHKKRSSDGLVTDYQLRQAIIIPKAYLGMPVSFLWYSNRSTTNISYSPYVQFFSDEGASVFISSTGLITPIFNAATLNEYTLVKCENIPVPSNAKSMIVCVRTQYDGSVLDTDFLAYHTCPVVTFGATCNSIVINSSIDDIALAKRVYPSSYGKKIATYGDSLTAANGFQPVIANEISATVYVRGCGSSAVSFSIGLMAVKPDGSYISRRNVFASDALFDADILAQGFTNLVTSPSWVTYSASPSSYTLPNNSFFKIETKGSSIERVATIPLDSDYVLVMYSNDLGVTSVGVVDNYNDGTYAGEFRLMLQNIENRVPNAKVIIMVPPKRTVEISGTTRSAAGVISDNIREMTRSIANVYGYEMIDHSKSINLLSLNLLSDGVHPTTAGYNVMGRYILKTLANN